jgi:hypothetical protein
VCHTVVAAAVAAAVAAGLRSLGSADGWVSARVVCTGDSVGGWV